MSATDPGANRLIHKADALIRRHRTFVASPADESPEQAPPTPTLASEDDIPVLTEVVDATIAHQRSAAGIVDSALTDQQQAIRAAIEHWVDEALPDAILHVLDGFTDRLVAAVSERARRELLASLEKDALANRESQRANAQ